jgi:hypothetical protein
MELKNKQLYDFNVAATALSKYGKGGFRVKMLIIEDLSKERIEKLDKIKDPSDEYKEFQTKYQELATAHSEMGDNGIPILYKNPDGTGEKMQDGFGFPNIINNVDEFKLKSEELSKEYDDAINSLVESEKEWLDHLEQDVDPEITFPTIDAKLLPDEINEEYDYSVYLRVLKPLIKY